MRAAHRRRCHRQASLRRCCRHCRCRPRRRLGSRHRRRRPLHGWLQRHCCWSHLQHSCCHCWAANRRRCYHYTAVPHCHRRRCRAEQRRCRRCRFQLLCLLPCRGQNQRALVPPLHWQQGWAHTIRHRYRMWSPGAVLQCLPRRAHPRARCCACVAAVDVQACLVDCEGMRSKPCEPCIERGHACRPRAL